MPDHNNNSRNDNQDDHWWIAALSEELLPGKPLAVMCDGREYVLFRDAHGAARALIDQCAHRRAPLSLGRITAEGWVECPYHGWRYEGSNGRCTNIPNLSAHERVPAYKVAAFAVEEHDGFIYLWPRGLDGDSSKLPVSDLTQNLEHGALSWQASKLIAYPHDALVDLLLDMPGAVLHLPGLTILDDHRYGEPVATATAVEIQHAVAWTPRGKLPRHAQSDYPLTLGVAVQHQGHVAVAELKDDAGQLLLRAQIGLTPVKPNLAAVHWRGIGGTYRERTLQLTVRSHLSAEAIKTAYAYPSKLRRESQARRICAA